jgi:hypothetical protein
MLVRRFQSEVFLVNYFGLAEITSLPARTAAGPKGGIKANGDSVWMDTNKDGTTLSRIDPTQLFFLYKAGTAD